MFVLNLLAINRLPNSVGLGMIVGVGDGVGVGAGGVGHSGVKFGKGGGGVGEPLPSPCPGPGVSVGGDVGGGVPGCSRGGVVPGGGDPPGPQAASPIPRDRPSTSRITSISHLPRDFLRLKARASRASGPSIAPVGSIGV